MIKDRANGRSCGLDCIVVGHAELPFREYQRLLEPRRDVSSAYANVLKNSVCIDGERLQYNELLSYALTKATGEHRRLSSFSAPSLPVVYLTSFLRRRGFEVDFVNYFNHDQDRFAQLLERKPRAVALTTTFQYMSEPLHQVVRFVRERQPETKIIIGGPYISNVCRDYQGKAQDFVLSRLGADIYIHDSQGEATLAAALTALRQSSTPNLSGIPNLIHRVGTSALERTGRSPESNNLNEETILWKSFDPDYLAPAAYMRTALSCPFTCAFCTYPEVAGKHKVMDVEVVEQQLRELSECGVTHLSFIDDTFNVPLPRFKKLCRMMIKNDFGIKWLSFLRPGNVDEEALDLMVESGCIGSSLGIESGDDRILKNMNKKVTVERYKWGIEQLKKRGLYTAASFIIGFPGETRESVRNTIDFINEAAPTWFVAEQYFHYEMTPINKRADEFGLSGGEYSWKHNTMDWQESAHLLDEVYRQVENSSILPILGLGLWSLPYLEGQGVPPDKFLQFTQLAKPMLLKSMIKTDVKLPQHYEERLIDLFRENPERRRRDGAGDVRPDDVSAASPIF